MYLSGNTTNFRNHLKGAHPQLMSTKPKTKTGSETQTKLFDMGVEVIPKPSPALPPLQPAKKRELDDVLQRYIVKKLKPFNTVDDPEFRNLLSALEPRYTPISSTTLTARVKELHQTSKATLKDQVQGLNVAITHDSWTSRATESFDTVTVHFVDGDWHLQGYVLQTEKVEGSHTAENIAGKVIKIKLGLCLNLHFCRGTGVLQEEMGAELSHRCV